jgi:hypothetical protein
MSGNLRMPDEEETIESLTEAVRGVIDSLTTQAWYITNIVHSLEDAGIKVRGVMHDRPPTH